MRRDARIGATAGALALALVLAGCAAPSRTGGGEPAPNMSGGGNPMTDSILAGCSNASTIAAAVSKAQEAVEKRTNQRPTAVAATRAFYNCTHQGASDLTRDWATLNGSYWLAHTAVQDQSGVKTLDEARHFLDALAAKTRYPEIRDGAQRMSAAFNSDEQQLQSTLKARAASARPSGRN